MDPLSLFGTILAVVQLIGMLASKMWDSKTQSKHKCLQLAGRVKYLTRGLQDLPDVAINDEATVGVQQTLKDALDEALRLIKYCQEGGSFLGKNCCRKVAELDSVDKNISNCIMDLMFISHMQGHITSLVPRVHDYNYNQANGGWPSPQHAGTTSQAYYQPPVLGLPPPAQDRGTPPYPAYRARSAYNLPSPYTLPPVDNIFSALRYGWDQGGHNSSSAMVTFAGTASHNEPNSKMHAYNHSHSATTSGSKELDRKEHLEKLRLVEEVDMNRTVRASIASAQSEQTARNHQAIVNNVLELSIASARDEDAARAKEAAVNRVVEESVTLALVQEASRDEEATMNRAAEESTAWTSLHDEEMLLALFASEHLAA